MFFPLQIYIFHVDTHPKFTWYTQCVDFGSYPSPAWQQAYMLFDAVLLFFVPLAVIIVTYTIILITINKNRRDIASGGGGGTLSSNQTSNNMEDMPLFIFSPPFRSTTKSKFYEKLLAPPSLLRSSFPIKSSPFSVVSHTQQERVFLLSTQTQTLAFLSHHRRRPLSSVSALFSGPAWKSQQGPRPPPAKLAAHA